MLIFVSGPDIIVFATFSGFLPNLKQFLVYVVPPTCSFGELDFLLLEPCLSPSCALIPSVFHNNVLRHVLDGNVQLTSHLDLHELYYRGSKVSARKPLVEQSWSTCSPSKPNPFMYPYSYKIRLPKRFLDFLRVLLLSMTEKTASNCKLCSVISWRSRWVKKKILCKIKHTTLKNPNQALFDIDFVHDG